MVKRLGLVRGVNASDFLSHMDSLGVWENTSQMSQKPWIVL